jgi:hypothetical protein
VASGCWSGQCLSLAAYVVMTSLAVLRVGATG